MSKESKNIHAARQWYIQKYSNNYFYKDKSFEFLLELLRKEIPNIRLNEYKFLLGILRIYIEEITLTPNIQFKDLYFDQLNGNLRIIYDLNLIDFFNRNLNGLLSFTLEEKIVSLSYRSNSKYESFLPKNYSIFKFSNSNEIRNFADKHPYLKSYLDEDLKIHIDTIHDRFCIIKSQKCFRKYSCGGVFYLLIKNGWLDNINNQSFDSESFKRSLYWIGYCPKKNFIISITDRDNFGMYRASSYQLTVSALEEILKVNVYKMIHNF